MIEVF